MNWKQSFKQGHHSCYSLQESSGPFQVSSGFLWISYTISIPTRLNLKELEPFTAVIGTIKGRMKEAKCLKLNHGRLQRRCASWVVPTNRGWRGMHKKNVSEVHMRVINNIVLLFFIFRHAHVRMYVHTNKHSLSFFPLSFSWQIHPGMFPGWDNVETCWTLRCPRFELLCAEVFFPFSRFDMQMLTAICSGQRPQNICCATFRPSGWNCRFLLFVGIYYYYWKLLSATICYYMTMLLYVSICY